VIVAQIAKAAMTGNRRSFVRQIIEVMILSSPLLVTPDQLGNLPCPFANNAADIERSDLLVRLASGTQGSVPHGGR
jgi:hypothetical protein